jgi:hypothetical protein
VGPAAAAAAARLLLLAAALGDSPRQPHLPHGVTVTVTALLPRRSRSGRPLLPRRSLRLWLMATAGIQQRLQQHHHRGCPTPPRPTPSRQLQQPPPTRTTATRALVAATTATATTTPTAMTTLTVAKTATAARLAAVRLPTPPLLPLHRPELPLLLRTGLSTAARLQQSAAAALVPPRVVASSSNRRRLSAVAGRGPLPQERLQLLEGLHRGVLLLTRTDGPPTPLRRTTTTNGEEEAVATLGVLPSPLRLRPTPAAAAAAAAALLHLLRRLGVADPVSRRHTRTTTQAAALLPLVRPVPLLLRRPPARARRRRPLQRCHLQPRLPWLQ